MSERVIIQIKNIKKSKLIFYITCTENVLFWLEIQSYLRERRRSFIYAQKIYSLFMAPNSPNQVNVSGNVRREVHKRIIQALENIQNNSSTVCHLLARGIRDIRVL